MLKKIMLALTFAMATGMAQAIVLLEENFDDVPALVDKGWIFRNLSVPPGEAPGWVQGNPGIFEAHEGAPNAYIASSFQSAAPGGLLDDQLFTPLFSLTNGAQATFWLRGADDFGFSDIVVYGYSNGATDPGVFIESMTVTAPVDGWTQFTLTIAPQADMMGRLGFIHSGFEATSNYVGLDTVRVDSLTDPAGVPEPATLMILGLGLAGLNVARRRR